MSLLPQRYYLRAIGITTLKDLVYLAMMQFGVQYIFGNIPQRMNVLVFGILFVLNTFLFSEWIFSDPVARSPRHAFAVVIVTFVVDVLLFRLVWSFLTNTPLLASLDIGMNLLVFGLHAAAMSAAFYDCKRLGRHPRGPMEGLAS